MNTAVDTSLVEYSLFYAMLPFSTDRAGTGNCTITCPPTTLSTYLVVWPHDGAGREVKTDFRPVQKVPETLSHPVLANLD